jgi:heme ABC exporter ATP-binding subunit CcmA
MAAAIRFRSAVALIGAFPVLAGVDLDVARGEIVLLEGANGAGKTSLLRACAGLLPVISGQAEVLGHDLLQDRRTVRRQLGLLGHATSLYDDLTVEDNVRFATRAGGGRGDEVAGALERLGLTGRLPATPVGRLSAGQRRRTALAVLVARDPELWLLDEPHAGLDAEHRQLLDGLVRDAAGRGATVVIASHEHERASALAGRVVTMAGGQVVTEADNAAGASRPSAGPVAFEAADGATRTPEAPVALFPQVAAHVA